VDAVTVAVAVPGLGRVNNRRVRVLF
jgi:hypothetical protein